MPLTLGDAPKGAGAPPAPQGNMPARCYSVIDLGTHTDDGQFGVKVQRKIRLSWELPDELHTFRDEKGPEPFAVHQTFTFSTHEKATFRKTLEAWRGRPFTDQELKTFELRKLIGTPCLLNVIHVTKGDRTYANIKAVTPVPKGMVVKDPVNAPVYYEVAMGQGEEFKALPDFIKEIISKSHEFTGKVSETPATTAGGSDDLEADDIPF